MESKTSEPLSTEYSIPVKVYITAPATLPAGYTFDATVQGFDDHTFPVEVVSTNSFLYNRTMHND